MASAVKAISMLPKGSRINPPIPDLPKSWLNEPSKLRLIQPGLGEGSIWQTLLRRARLEKTHWRCNPSCPLSINSSFLGLSLVLFIYSLFQQVQTKTDERVAIRGIKFCHLFLLFWQKRKESGFNKGLKNQVYGEGTAHHFHSKKHGMLMDPHYM